MNNNTTNNYKTRWIPSFFFHRQASLIEVLGKVVDSATYPLSKKKHSLEYLRVSDRAPPNELWSRCYECEFTLTRSLVKTWLFECHSKNLLRPLSYTLTFKIHRTCHVTPPFLFL